MFKHILIPNDGSDLSEKAFTNGITLAKSFGARITIVTATAPFHMVALEPIMLTPDLEDRYMQEAESLAQQRLKTHADKAAAAGVECTTVHVFNNHPYEAIIETANTAGCDVIFMASHGRRGVAALLLGGETHKVLTHCKIPVIVWR